MALATIRNKAENDFVQNLLKVGIYHKYAAWIGLSAKQDGKVSRGVYDAPYVQWFSLSYNAFWYKQSIKFWDGIWKYERILIWIYYGILQPPKCLSLSGYWVSLRRRNSSFGIACILAGGFQWEDNSVVDYVNWGNGEPSNNKTRTSEDCVIIGATTGTWYDKNCLNKQRFVCSTLKGVKPICIFTYLSYSKSGILAQRIWGSLEHWAKIHEQFSKGVAYINKKQAVYKQCLPIYSL